MSKEAHLRKLALAMTTWRDAQESAEFAQLHDSISEFVFNGIAAGIVTTYCRPFMSGEGVGTISKEFEMFPADKAGRELQGQHMYLLVLRNKVFAHFDLAENKKQLAKIAGAGPADEVKIELNLSGFVLSHTALIFGRQQLKQTVDLLTFQRHRLQVQFEKALSAYFGQKPPLGNFRITSDGIKSA